MAGLPDDYRSLLLNDLAADEAGELSVVVVEHLAAHGQTWLKSDPNAPEWVREYHGPFSIYIRRKD